MKIKYKRFTEMSCFTIRDHIGAAELKMLQVGFESIVKDLEEMLVVNMVHATVDPSVHNHIIELKNKLGKMTSKKIYWITKEKGLGDFPSINPLISRYQGSKMRQIGDRILLDDEVYGMELEIATVEAEIKKLGFDEASAHKALQQNTIVKTQKKTLEGALKWQRKRKTESHPVKSDVEELDLKIKQALDSLTKVLGSAVDL